MSMSACGPVHAVSDINVTPLIDILLVLLLIFMVIVPATPRGLDLLLPQPPTLDRPVPESTIMAQVLANGRAEPSYLINEIPLSKSQIVPKLTSIFASRQSKVMFVKGDTSLEFSQIAEVIDMGHQAEVDSIGLITPGIAAGK